MSVIRATRLNGIVAALFALLVMFGGLVTYDVTTAVERGATAEASHGSGPAQSQFDGCHHNEDYVDIWVDGVKWRSSQFSGPSYFNTNIYHHSSSDGWVWHDTRGYTASNCIVIGGM